MNSEFYFGERCSDIYHDELLVSNHDKQRPIFLLYRHSCDEFVLKIQNDFMCTELTTVFNILAEIHYTHFLTPDMSRSLQLYKPLVEP